MLEQVSIESVPDLIGKRKGSNAFNGRNWNTKWQQGGTYHSRVVQLNVTSESNLSGILFFMLFL